MVCFYRNRFVLLSSFFFLSIYCLENMENSIYLSENSNHEENVFSTGYFAENELAPFSKNTISEQIGKVTNGTMILMSK